MVSAKNEPEGAASPGGGEGVWHYGGGQHRASSLGSRDTCCPAATVEGWVPPALRERAMLGGGQNVGPPRGFW